MHRSLRLFLMFALVLPVLTETQERVVVGGPPPEIRTLVDSFLKAVNANADAFEAMAKAHFSKTYLAAQTPAARATLHAEIRKQFGTVTMERVQRQGPDEPLELNVKGSTGATGAIVLTMDAESPFTVSGVRLETGARKPGGRGGRPVPAPIDPGMSDDELARALDSHLAQLAAEDTLSGAVLVAKNGRPIFQKAYGFADRGNRILNTTGTRFNLGSINKTFTQIAIGQLVAAGKLAPTDTLGALLPDYPQALTRTATVAQLLGHTAGISDVFGEEFSRASKDRFRSNADYFGLVSRLPPLFAPGERNQVPATAATSRWVPSSSAFRACRTSAMSRSASWLRPAWSTPAMSRATTSRRASRWDTPGAPGTGACAATSSPAARLGARPVAATRRSPIS